TLEDPAVDPRRGAEVIGVEDDAPGHGLLPSRLPQVEEDQAVVLQQAAEAAPEEVAQAGVVVQPPEGGPAEGDERATGAPQAPQLGQGGGIVGRGAPVLAVVFREGERPAAAEGPVHAPLPLVDEEEGLSRRQSGGDVADCLVEALGGPAGL